MLIYLGSGSSPEFIIHIKEQHSSYKGSFIITG